VKRKAECLGDAACSWAAGRGCLSASSPKGEPKTTRGLEAPWLDGSDRSEPREEREKLQKEEKRQQRQQRRAEREQRREERERRRAERERRRAERERRREERRQRRGAENATAIAPGKEVVAAAPPTLAIKGDVDADEPQRSRKPDASSSALHRWKDGKSKPQSGVRDRYASSHRLGEALHQHCLKKTPLTAEVQECLAEMFKTDQEDQSLKARLARRLSAYTRGSQLCNYDICDLERLDGQRAIVDVETGAGRRLLVPDRRRCSDAKLANLHSVNRCHRSLTLVATEMSLMLTLGTGNVAKRLLRWVVPRANFLYPFAKSQLSVTALSFVDQAVQSAISSGAFGAALGVFGLSLAPALSTVLMMLPTWSMPDCKRGHYSADGWLMFFCSSVSGLLFAWVSHMVMVSVEFAKDLKWSKTGDEVIDRLRMLGTVPAGILGQVGGALQRLREATPAAAAATAVSSAIVMLFDTFTGYIFDKLPSVIKDVLQGLTQLFSFSALPAELEKRWKQGVAAVTGNMSYEAWSNVMARADEVFEVYKKTKNITWSLDQSLDELRKTAKGLYSGSKYLLGSFVGTERDPREERLIALWSESGLLLQNLSLMMLNAKDWATCFLALELDQALRRRQLRALNKKTAVTSADRLSEKKTLPL